MMDSFQVKIEENSNDLDTLDTFEICYCIAGNVARQIEKMAKCNECSQKVLTESPRIY